MYLAERIIGVSVYMVILFVFYYYIKYKLKDTKKLKKVLLLYNIILAVLAFFYIPTPSADLTRHFNNLKIASSYSLAEMWSYSTKTAIPVFWLYIFFISKLKLPGLLPAITSFIFHGCVFSILNKCANKYKIDQKSIATSLLLFMEMGKFLEVISGIRCLLAFSVICYCIYTELVEEKTIYKNILLYLFACLMHPAAIAFTIIRLIYFIFQKNRNIIYKVVSLGFIFAMLIYFAINPNSFIDAMIGKTELYLNSEMYFYIWEYLISWISVIFAMYSLLKYKKLINQCESLKNYYKFLLMLNCILVIFSFEYSIFSRFQTALSILFMPMLCYILSESKKNNINLKRYNIALTMVLIANFILASTRGNLCGYKFFIFR